MSNIAFVLIDYSYAGGVERVNAVLPEILNKADIPIPHIISLKSGFEQPHLQYPAQVKIKVLQKGNVVGQFEPALTAYLKSENIKSIVLQGDNIGIAKRMLQSARDADCIAHVHYHGSPFGYIKTYLYANDIKINPFNLFKFLWGKIVQPFKTWRVSTLVKNCTGKFICVSEGVQKEMLQLFPWTKDNKNKIICIPNPISFKADNSTIANKENIITYVGRLERKHKNTHMLLRAWQRVQHVNRDWKLVLLGHGRKDNEIRELAAALKLERIYFEGVVQDVGSYLSKSSIAVLTSDCEGMPMSMIEAGVYKNALLSTKSDGGITDIIVDGKTGLLVPKNDDALFASKLLELMNNAEKRNTLGNAAALHLQKLADDQIAAAWKKILMP